MLLAVLRWDTTVGVYTHEVSGDGDETLFVAGEPLPDGDWWAELDSVRCGFIRDCSVTVGFKNEVGVFCEIDHPAGCCCYSSVDVFDGFGERDENERAIVVVWCAAGGGGADPINDKLSACFLNAAGVMLVKERLGFVVKCREHAVCLFAGQFHHDVVHAVDIGRFAEAGVAGAGFIGELFVEFSYANPHVFPQFVGCGGCAVAEEFSANVVTGYPEVGQFAAVFGYGCKLFDAQPCGRSFVKLCGGEETGIADEFRGVIEGVAERLGNVFRFWLFRFDFKQQLSTVAGEIAVTVQQYAHGFDGRGVEKR